MTKHAALVAALLLLIPRHAYPDGRINGRMDFSRTSVDGAYNNVGLDWPGLEVELENEFKTPKVVLSGFSFGLRRELFHAVPSNVEHAHARIFRHGDACPG